MNQRWFPHVTVAAVIERENKYLMVEEKSNNSIVFNQPAGHLEKDESLKEAIIRETLEETGWQFNPTHLVGIYRFIAPNKETYLRFTFCGELENQISEFPLDEAIIRTHWFGSDELSEHSHQLRSEVVMQCIDDFNRGIRLTLDSVKDLQFPS